MVNQYHDARGRFTNRANQAKRVEAAAAAGNFTEYMAEKQALEEVDLKRGVLPETTLRNGVLAAVSESAAETITRDDLILNGTAEDLETFITERTNRPDYLNLINERNRTRDLAKFQKDEYDTLLKASKKDPDMDYSIVRQKGLQLLNTYESLQILKQQTDAYKDITAPAAARLSQLAQEEAERNGTYQEYTEDTLNNLERVGDFPSGSREWLESRQEGIGGSDVGKIIGLDRQYAQRDYEEVLSSKVNPITDEQVESQTEGHTAYAGASGRGNAWEEAIAQKFALNNPDITIIHCKGSWRNSQDNTQRINFDGLMADAEGNIDGVLEIKTASDASKWGHPDTGLDGVPSGYRAQVLHYMRNADLKRGAVAVLIDDREYREYHFTYTPELAEEAEKNYLKGKEFWEEVEAQRNGTHSEAVKAAARKGFSNTVLNSGTAGSKTAIFDEVATYREMTREQVITRYEELINKEDRKDPEKVRTALTKLYTEHDPATNTTPFINLDLETSAGSPTKGHIIEVGISVTSPKDGTVQERFSKLYGLSTKALRATGTGPVEVHHITEGMIAKKRQFSHAGEQKQLLDTLKKGILVAHNLPFEDRWLSLHLEGYAEAKKNGEIRGLDTMRLTQRFLPTEDNTLRAMVEHYGDEYVNAHRAIADAEMMAKSLQKFREDLHQQNN